MSCRLYPVHIGMSTQILKKMVAYFATMSELRSPANHVPLHRRVVQSDIGALRAGEGASSALQGSYWAGTENQSAPAPHRTSWVALRRAPVSPTLTTERSSLARQRGETLRHWRDKEVRHWDTEEGTSQTYTDDGTAVTGETERWDTETLRRAPVSPILTTERLSLVRQRGETLRHWGGHQSALHWRLNGRHWRDREVRHWDTEEGTSQTYTDDGTAVTGETERWDTETLRRAPVSPTLTTERPSLAIQRGETLRRAPVSPILTMERPSLARQRGETLRHWGGHQSAQHWRRNGRHWRDREVRHWDTEEGTSQPYTDDGTAVTGETERWDTETQRRAPASPILTMERPSLARQRGETLTHWGGHQSALHWRRNGRHWRDREVRHWDTEEGTSQPYTDDGTAVTGETERWDTETLRRAPVSPTLTTERPSLARQRSETLRHWGGHQPALHWRRNGRHWRDREVRIGEMVRQHRGVRWDTGETAQTEMWNNEEAARRSDETLGNLRDR